jgi:uncharacterized protein (TIGR03067 family)
MKTLSQALVLSLLGCSLLCLMGCSTARQSKASPAEPVAAAVHTESSASTADEGALQGKWQGKEVGSDSDKPCYFVVSGKTFEFHGSDPREWYKGTFSLREDTTPKQLVGLVTECPAPRYIGKASMAIYRLGSGKLTLAAFRPGTPDAPADFTAPEARCFEFSK